MTDLYLARIEFERTLYIKDFTDKFRHNSWGTPFPPKKRDRQAMDLITRKKGNSDEYALPSVQRKWVTLLAILKSLEKQDA